jgi:hypothetical protein
MLALSATRAITLPAQIAGNKARGRRVGPWTIPDVVSIAVQQLTQLPGEFIEVVTFEIKPSHNVTALTVYEAFAHPRSATHAYVVLHVPHARC